MSELPDLRAPDADPLDVEPRPPAAPSSLAAERVPYARRVFVNRNLRLDRIRFIGFDMDYTLARYHVAMEHLQAGMVCERLEAAPGFPKRLVEGLAYDPGFAIRGLGVDREHGHVFKADAHRYVGKAWHGTGPLDRDTWRAHYTNRKLSPSRAHVTMVDTLFALPEISLYCQLVARMDAHRAQTAAGAGDVDYDGLWLDLREAMDSIHRDGTLKARIRQDLAKYIIHDPELAETLHRFRSAGKRLFVLTNSEPSYTDAVMSYLLDPPDSGGSGGHGHSYRSWRDYFDFTICDGGKPGFFVGDAPLVEVGPDGEPLAQRPRKLHRGATYSGGNVQELEKLVGIDGDEVLYVGDHIYGDILRSKSHTHWRTALVVQEMDRELHMLEGHAGELAELQALEERHATLTLELHAQALGSEGKDRALVEEVRALGREAAAREQALSQRFHPYWGPLFRDRRELSAFGRQVESYACVYTSRVSNFRFYSPMTYFRSPRDRMPHELVAR